MVLSATSSKRFLTYFSTPDLSDVSAPAAYPSFYDNTETVAHDDDDDGESVCCFLSFFLLFLLGCISFCLLYDVHADDSTTADSPSFQDDTAGADDDTTDGEFVSSVNMTAWGVFSPLEVSQFVFSTLSPI